MSETINIIAKEAQQTLDEIVTSLATQKIDNTGAARESLRLEIKENQVLGIGIFYLEFLDKGRGPGKMPPFQPIFDWVTSKLGLSGTAAMSATYHIRNKIADHGTDIFINNELGIELDEKIEKLRERIKKNIGESIKVDVKRELDKYLKIWKAKQKQSI